MVITRGPKKRFVGGFLIADAVVAMAILLIALVPLTMAFGGEGRLARRYYERAIAEQIVDGEFEILQAGGWHELPSGAHAYAVRARAAVNLPPGAFRTTLAEGRLRLEWRAEDPRRGATVVREGRVR